MNDEKCTSPGKLWIEALSRGQEISAADPTRNRADQKRPFRFVRETNEFFWNGVKVTDETAAQVIGFTLKVISEA